MLVSSRSNKAGEKVALLVHNDLTFETYNPMQFNVSDKDSQTYMTNCEPVYRYGRRI